MTHGRETCQKSRLFVPLKTGNLVLWQLEKKSLREKLVPAKFARKGKGSGLRRKKMQANNFQASEKESRMWNGPWKERESIEKSATTQKLLSFFLSSPGIPESYISQLEKVGLRLNSSEDERGCDVCQLWIRISNDRDKSNDWNFSLFTPRRCQQRQRRPFVNLATLTCKDSF